ncbi:MAG TPA: PPC domain-containing protein [Frankiaceae bacterium]|nr:PPC domain-containing protein [Frankiaceae bacterium]
MRSALCSVLLAALLPLTVASPASAAPLPQNDAGTGRDAPGVPTPTFRVEPGRVYSGTVDGYVLDKADWYAFSAPAGATLEARGSGAFSCVRLANAAGAELAYSCGVAAESTSLATAVATAAGTYYVQVSALQPDAYRFSVGVGEPAPSPAPVGLLSTSPVAPLPSLVVPPVGPATTTGEHVVVAVVDTGVNPYHEFLRAPALTAHPSGWLSGFPASASPVALSLGAPDYATAAAADAPTLNTLARSTYDPVSDTFDERLYTFPGTRVVGGISFSRPTADEPSLPDRPVIDDTGYGSASAGLAAGSGTGAADGNVLVVAVEADVTTYPEAVRWVARQPWIDAVVMSAGFAANAPFITTSPTGTRDGIEWATREAAASGKPVIVPANRVFTALVPSACSTHTDAYAGPAWVTRVGMRPSAAPAHCVPVDAVAATTFAPAHDSLTAMPAATDVTAYPANLAGHFAHVLLAGRRAGSAADRTAVLDHLLHAAMPVPRAGNDPMPASPVTLAEQGYGLVDQDALDAASTRLLAGSGPAPRPETTEWFARDRALRTALWGPESATSGPPLASVFVHDDASSGADAPETPAGAPVLMPGWVYDGIRYGGDDTYDWFAFSGAAGDTFQLEHSGGNACFTLVGPDGVAFAGSSCSLAYLSSPSVTATLDRAGTWYLRVDGAAPSTYSFGFTLDGSAPPLVLA